MTTDKTTVTANATPFGRDWRLAGWLWLLAMAATLALFADTTMAMVDTWLNSATYNHCLLIPVICAYLVWERKEIFRRTPPSPSILGLAVTLGAGFLWLLGHLVGVLMIEEFALVFALQGLTLAIVGRAVSRALILPIGFMLFAVPFGEFLIQPLQNVTADFIVWGLRAIDIPVFINGVFLSTPTGEFHVAEACSGVRFLIAMIPLGVLLADMAFKSWTRRLVVMALSIIIPIVANGIRAFGIVYIAYLTDNEYATGVDHIVYGWIFFSIVMLAVIFISMSFSDKPIDTPAIDISAVAATSPVAPLRVAVIAMLALATAAPWPWLADRALGVAPMPIASLAAPSTVSDWSLVDNGLKSAWHPLYRGVSDELLASYRRPDGAEVAFYYGYYAAQRNKGELVQFGNGVAPGKWDWSASRNQNIAWQGGQVVARESEITSVGESRRVWHWYWVGGYLTSNDYMAKALHLWARLSGSTDNAAVIAMSTREGYKSGEATVVLEDFLQHVRADLPGFQTDINQ